MNICGISEEVGIHLERGFFLLPDIAEALFIYKPIVGWKQSFCPQ